PAARLVDPRHARRRHLGGARLHDRLFPVLLPDALVHAARHGQAGARASAGGGALMKNLLIALLLAPLLAMASEAGYRLDHSPHDQHDTVSLQAGARTYMNYSL